MKNSFQKNIWQMSVCDCVQSSMTVCSLAWLLALSCFHLKCQVQTEQTKLHQVLIYLLRGCAVIHDCVQSCMTMMIECSHPWLCVQSSMTVCSLAWLWWLCAVIHDCVQSCMTASSERDDWSLPVDGRWWLGLILGGGIKSQNFSKFGKVVIPRHFWVQFYVWNPGNISVFVKCFVFTPVPGVWKFEKSLYKGQKSKLS